MGSIIHKLESFEIMGACFDFYKQKVCAVVKFVCQECLELELPLGLRVNFAHYPKLEYERIGL